MAWKELDSRFFNNYINISFCYNFDITFFYNKVTLLYMAISFKTKQIVLYYSNETPNTLIYPNPNTTNKVRVHIMQESIYSLLLSNFFLKFLHVYLRSDFFFFLSFEYYKNNIFPYGYLFYKVQSLHDTLSRVQYLPKATISNLYILSNVN